MEKKLTLVTTHLFRTRKGRIDIWVLEYDYHNGPLCVKCNTCKCEHCDPGFLTEDCSIPHYVDEDGAAYKDEAGLIKIEVEGYDDDDDENEEAQ